MLGLYIILMGQRWEGTEKKMKPRYRSKEEIMRNRSRMEKPYECSEFALIDPLLHSCQEYWNGLKGCGKGALDVCL